MWIKLYLLKISLFIIYINQINLNRFLSSKFDLEFLKKEHINVINEIEKDCILVIEIF